VKTIPFIPIPLAGTDNPTLIRRMVDTSLWLESLELHCLSNYHSALRKMVTESFGPGNRTVHYMSELSLPLSLETYDTKNVMLPGWQNLPAALEALTEKKEKELITCLIKDVNSVFFSGLDENPNLSRSAARPMAKESQRKTKAATNATLTVGGSNATRLAEALANLGIDSYKLATPGWKLNKENVEKIVPDLKEILETIPQDAPVIFFCLDNTVFKVATAEGELTNISKCVAEDDGFHVNGSLVVAPDFFIKNQIELLKQLVSYCGGRTVLILCPVPRYATFRCCDDPGYGYQGRFDHSYGVRDGGSQFGDRRGGRYGYQEQQTDGGYGYGGYRQQRDDRYYTARGEPRGRRFHGRRPYGGRGR
jgi:hypothetical protein